MNLYAYSHAKYMLPQLCLFVEVFAYGEMFCTCAALQNPNFALPSVNDTVHWWNAN